jgi:pimeloyl-ACP methyl ester carboxylesterase
MMQKQILQLDPYHAAYIEQGTGFPVIFLHGFLGEGSYWLPVMSHLPEHRCIALDLLGFGESSKPELRYNIWHQVEFLQQFVQALKLERFWLVGHSYGGWTAADYAIACTTGHTGLPHAQEPLLPPHNALNGLVLVAPAGIRDDKFVGRYAHLRPLLWETPWIDWGLKAIAPISRLIGQQDAFAEIANVREALLAQPVAKSFLRDRLRPEDAIDTVEQNLHQIQVPTLVIAAQQDETIPLWHTQAYAEGIAGAQRIVLEDAEHGLLQTHHIFIAQQIARLSDLGNG